MKVLVVLAHPEPLSFCSALADTAVRTLLEAGHDVEVSNLYALSWHPTLGINDFSSGRSSNDFFDPSAEQEHAFATGLQPTSVAAEQAKVAASDLIIFHFPVWWFSMPAILKGWFDRVFARGFAYSAGRKYDNGHFTGKKAMLCLTTGTSSSTYEPSGIDGDLLHVLWPIHNGILAYTGFTVLPPFVAWMPGKVDSETRADYLSSYARHLDGTDSLTPLFFHPREDYDETQRLKPGVPARSGVQWNPRADQSFEQAAQQAHDRPTTES